MLQKSWKESNFQVVEGDVLLLDTETAKTAVEPRATGAVDMAKQLGRDDDGLVDDFEELVLSPKRLEPRSSCLVDMAKELWMLLLLLLLLLSSSACSFFCSLLFRGGLTGCSKANTTAPHHHPAEHCFSGVWSTSRATLGSTHLGRRSTRTGHFVRIYDHRMPQLWVVKEVPKKVWNVFLPLWNESRGYHHLKIDGWNTNSFPFGKAYFQVLCC